LKSGALLLEDGTVKLPDGRTLLRDGRFAAPAKDWFADDGGDESDSVGAAYEPAAVSLSEAYEPEMIRPSHVFSARTIVVSPPIAPLSAAPLQALLSKLYARWRCRVCGERSASAEELAAHVARHRAAAGVISAGVDAVTALRISYAQSTDAARTARESLGEVVGSSRAWFARMA
jgi:hypothetical protein